MTAETKRTLNAKDVAQYLGLSRKTIYNMLKDQRFNVPPIPNTSPRRWAIEAVDAWRLAGVRNVMPAE